MDPVIPIVTSGRVGDAKFVWQVQRSTAIIDGITRSTRDSRCGQAIERLPVLCDPKNLRLLAACAYLQRAMRLISAGSGPSEFASEAVVNMTKALEVIFPGSKPRDSIRAGLQRIWYESSAVEEKFVPALLLRAKLDAAHVRLATLQADERRKLQIYMERAIVDFRMVITKAIKAVADNSLELATYRDERKPGDEISKILDRIVEPPTRNKVL